LSLPGCFRGYQAGRYTPAPTPNATEFPDHEIDLARLQDLFQLRGGQLYDPDVESEVAWRDYSFFRVYEFSRHSAVIYPAGWNEGYYNIRIYAGHLPHNERLLNTIGHRRSGEHSEYVIFRDLELDGSVFEGDTIGMDGAFFGQTSSEYAISLAGMPNNVWLNRIDVYADRVKHYEESFEATNNTLAAAVIRHGQLNCYHEVVLENNRVVYVQYIHPDSTGPMLGQYAINRPLTPIIDSGVLNLSEGSEDSSLE